MSRKSPFKRHRFPAVIILCAVRMYLRYPLSYQDVVDLLAERRLSAAKAPRSGLNALFCTEPESTPCRIARIAPPRLTGCDRKLCWPAIRCANSRLHIFDKCH